MPRYCLYNGCDKRTTFGNPNEKTPTHCSPHGKLLGMINIGSKKCKQKGCSTQPTFGFLNDKTPTYCGPHGKLLGMLDILNKKCLQDGCSIQPNFGFLNDKSATYCSTHGKLLGMIDIITKRCMHDGCPNVPSFGHLDDKRATYCSIHADKNMVDITHKRCLQDGCDIKNPTFGFPDDKSPTYCSPHGQLLGMVDIISKRCLEDGCDTGVSFGFPNDKTPTYCGLHGKPLGMINISSKKCLQDGCNKQPHFGFPDDKMPTYCGVHGQLLGMIDIGHKKCETCSSTRMNQNYKPNCARCNFYLNPDDPRIRNYKTKEQAYMNALLEKFPQFKLDKIIDGGCSRRRPDGFLDLLTHVIIIEIDENEHKSYDDTCNNRRTMELSQDVGHRPIVFIRLNPDSYKLNDTHMKGSFSLTKTGELKIVKKEFNKRLNSLIESVKKHMSAEPDKTISVEYLYFTE